MASKFCYPYALPPRRRQSVASYGVDALKAILLHVPTDFIDAKTLRDCAACFVWALYTHCHVDHVGKPREWLGDLPKHHPLAGNICPTHAPGRRGPKDEHVHIRLMSRRVIYITDGRGRDDSSFLHRVPLH